jgi:predicted subunit of tRNA(5-methylaminomethyl-2-thiouridylate) methyltransferase
VRAEKKQTFDVAIIDLAGVKRYAGRMAAQQGLGSQTIRLDNNIGRGIYFLLVKDGNSTQAIKFIKN